MCVEQNGNFSVLHLGAQCAGIPAREGKGGGIGRTADVLSVQSGGIHLAVAVLLYGDHRGCAVQVSLINRVGNPPVVPLIDIGEHQLAAYVEPGKLGFGAAPGVNDGKTFPAVGVKIGLVAAEFAVMLTVFVIGKLHPRLAEFPAVNREGIFAQIG